MKARFLAVASALVLAASAWGAARAQAAPAIQARSRSDEIIQKRVNMRLESLAAHVELTEVQKAQLRPIFEAEADELRSLRMNPSLAPEEQQAQFVAIQKSYREKVDAILTPEQQKKRDAMAAEDREKLRAMQAQRRKGRVKVVDDPQ